MKSLLRKGSKPQQVLLTPGQESLWSLPGRVLLPSESLRRTLSASRALPVLARATRVGSSLAGLGAR